MGIKAEKLKRKRELAEETKRIQNKARLRKLKEKQRRQLEHQKRIQEAIELRALKKAARAEKHALLASQQEKKTIERKKREVNIEFSDFGSISEALTAELSKYGTVENIRRTLSGCEARFETVEGAQESVAAGEVEATIHLTIQPAEIKQH